MFDILFCIRDDHDLRLVALAAGVCLLSAITAVTFVRQAIRTGGKASQVWTVVGGAATGFGIWATHFIAMLGYDPGVIAGYQMDLTLASLGIVVAATILGFRIATLGRTQAMILAASVVVGGGIAAMHYVGMMALEMPATIRWNLDYVALSLVLVVAPLFPALVMTVHQKSGGSGLCAGLLITAAIVGLHFSGMTAITLIPARIELEEALLSPHAMSILIGAVSVGLLALSIVSGLLSRRTRARIEASERQFSILVQGISDCAIYWLDSSGHVANWNAGAQRLKGYSADEAVGMPLSNFYTDEDRAVGAPAAALAHAETEGKFTGAGWRMRKDGSRFWAHVTIERIRDGEGKHLGFAKITRDMTRFKEDQDRIAETSRHLDAALAHMHQGLCLFDADARLVLHNTGFLKLWSLPGGSNLVGLTLDEIAEQAASASGNALSSQSAGKMQTLLSQSLLSSEYSPTIAELSDTFVVSIASRALPEGGWVTTFDDITERRRSEAQIAHMALHDGLTGLPNRTSFNRWLDKEIEHARDRSQQVAVIAVDLDRFKEINDAQGHAAGDMVLQQIAESMLTAAEDGEIVARIGGDEFAAAKHFDGPDELADFVARMNYCLSMPHAAQDGIAVGASLGIAVYPADAADREGLLNNADLAMYRAKKSLGEHICYYEPGMDETARNRRQLANELRQALARHEMRVLYQPQHSLVTQEVSGYEALLRWHHPTRGTVSPADFIPIAEENGEVIKLGEWVLRTACAEAARWAVAHKVAVNLSPVQLLQPDLPEIVTNILLETGLSPRRLELEITETAIIADKARALHSLRRIKALGVSVAMDDFGTGYSSLDTLHSFPFDKIKIDKSFLLDSERNSQSRAIIRAVLALGKSLDIPVLAEGVETEAQLALLLDEGCAEAQGYFFGRPAQAPSHGEIARAAGE